MATTTTSRPSSGGTSPALGYETVMEGRLRVTYRADFPPAAAHAVVAAHRDAIFLRDARVLKVDRKTALTRITASDGRAVVVKQYVYGGAARGVAQRLHISRGRRAVIGLERLRAAGARVPALHALVERFGFGMVIESIVIMEDLAPRWEELDRRLARWERHGPPAERAAQVRRAAAALADELRRRHDRQALHRDLKTCNIMILAPRPAAPPGDASTPPGAADDPRFAFVDCDAATADAPITGRGLALALAQLSASTPAFVGWRERLRFVKRYLGRAGPFTSADRRLLREADALARRHAILFVGLDGDRTEPWSRVGW
ncbi:MAG: hypothetical protein HY719_07260 [Planctomycetes bacterium]|nr:hypothetical protein [Planctomycetota bacterium]